MMRGGGAVGGEFSSQERRKMSSGDIFESCSNSPKVEPTCNMPRTTTTCMHSGVKMPDNHQLTHLHAWGLLKQLQEAGKKKVCEAHNGRRWYEDGP